MKKKDIKNDNQIRLFEYKKNEFPVLLQTETACGQFEEIDCSDKNIILPSEYKPNTVLSLTLNRSSQQPTRKYDTTMSQHIRDVKEQMKNQFFRMSHYPCNFSSDKKALLFIGNDGKVENVRYKFKSCNSWTCPRCAPIKAKAIGHQISEIAITNNLIYYLTLTLDPKKISPEDILDSRTHKLITGFFNHFITTIKRKKFTYFRDGKTYRFDLKNKEEKLKYIWVIEFQRNGLAHMHILLNKFLPVEIIRKVWTHVGGGHIMKIEKAKNIQAVGNYITKYIFKEFENIDQVRNTFHFFEKRYSISQSCQKPPKVTTRMFEKDVDNFDINIKMKELRLDWVYNTLNPPPINNHSDL
ncbi:MAG: hypothetical protein PHD49_00195 [Candidatus Shapirobacteria bacterium]|nr:hypothetical protein [Candidatus Shapirobacteria bacterium]